MEDKKMEYGNLLRELLEQKQYTKSSIRSFDRKWQT